MGWLVTDELKPLAAPITVEKNFLVGGKRVTFQAVFPAFLGKEIGLENVYKCAQKVLVRVEGKGVEVRELKLGE